MLYKACGLSWAEAEALAVENQAAAFELEGKRRSARSDNAISYVDSDEDDDFEPVSKMSRVAAARKKQYQKHMKAGGKGVMKQKSDKALLLESQTKAPAKKKQKKTVSKEALQVQKLPKTRAHRIVVGGKLMPKKQKSSTQMDFIRSLGAPPPKSAAQRKEEKVEAARQLAEAKAAAEEERKQKQRRPGRPKSSGKTQADIRFVD